MRTPQRNGTISLLCTYFPLQLQETKRDRLLRKWIDGVLDCTWLTLRSADDGRWGGREEFIRPRVSRIRLFSKLGVSTGLKRALGDYPRGEIVFHNHGLWRMHNIYPATISKRNSIPLVISPHGSFGRYPMSFSKWSKKLFLLAGQERALATAHCLHATSEMEYVDIREHGLLKQPICTIPVGVEIPPLRAPDRAVKPGRTVLYLSRLHPKKQPDMLLRAWQALENRNPDWSLRIVGPMNSPYALGLVKLSADLGLKKELTLPERCMIARSSMHSMMPIFMCFLALTKTSASLLRRRWPQACRSSRQKERRGVDLWTIGLGGG